MLLQGWLHRRRDHGGLIFLDLRDRYGLVQAVFNPERAPLAHRMAGECRLEFVLEVEGEVALRPPLTENPNLPTGQIEVLADVLRVLNPALTPPFEIADDLDIDEQVRMRYRYLDLRRPRMTSNIALRHRATKYIRDFLDARGFIEVETPILVKSTPEGARDYLVPSRLHPGEFYALPQSPQQLKQLLMVAGLDRYFQLARCFRDEDLRADRQPDFTQLDVEMSFVDQDDILDLTEALFTGLTEALTDFRVHRPFPRLTYREAMDHYGTDKPDLRLEMPIADLTDIGRESSFQVFKSVVMAGGVVRALVARGAADYSRRQLDELEALARALGAAGLAWAAFRGEEVRSSFARNLAEAEFAAICERTGAHAGDLLLVVASDPETAAGVLGRLRTADREPAAQGACQSVRPGLQRGGASERQPPDPSARGAGGRLSSPRANPRADRAPLWPHAARVRVRRPTSRRDRLWLRPRGHAAGWGEDYSRRHSVPQKQQRRRPDDGRAFAGRRGSAPRAWLSAADDRGRTIEGGR